MRARAPAPRAEPARRTAALVVVALGVLVSAGTATLVTAVVPAVAADLGAGTAATAWMITVYFVVYAVGIPVYGAVAARRGIRPLLAAGLAVFALGAAACALAPTLPVLLAARVLQAAGGAALPGLAMTVATRSGAVGAASGVGIVMAAASTGGVLGPVVGGAVADAAGWRALFLGVGVVMAALVGPVLATVPAMSAGGRAGPGRHGWRRLLRDRTWVAGTAAVGLVSCAFLATQFVVPVALADLAGAGPREAGLALTPAAAGMAIAGLLAGRVADRWGTARVAVPGFAVVLAGLVAAALVVGAGSLPLAAAVGLAGAGFGMVVAPLVAAATVRLPADLAAPGTSLQQSLQFVAGGSGPLVAGAVVAAGLGYRTAIVVAALLVVAAAAVAALLRSPAPASAAGVHDRSGIP